MIRFELTQVQADAVAKPSRYKYELNGTITVFDGPDYITPATREISTFDFIARFTPTEWAACLSFTYSGTGNATAMGIILQLQTSPTVGLDNVATIQDMAFWVANGCITTDRSAIILS